MAAFGVVVAVLHEGNVLLTQREDFAVWCLPGGGVDPRESIDQAAVREVFEETGIVVQLTQFVGMLNRPLWGRDGTHLAVFAARPLTLAFRLDPREL